MASPLKIRISLRAIVDVTLIITLLKLNKTFYIVIRYSYKKYKTMVVYLLQQEPESFSKYVYCFCCQPFTFCNFHKN